MRNKCTSWFLCGRTFWNGFFQPRHKIVFLILFLVTLAVIYTLCYVLLALYFEAICTEHANAFLIFFFSNLFQILVGIQILHFLAVNPKQLTVLRCSAIYLGILACLAMSIPSLVLWATQPTNDDIKDYIVNFLKVYNRVPRIYDKLQQDSKCCGVKSFQDYGDPKTKQFLRLPDSCCKNMVKDCASFRGAHLNGSLTADQIRDSAKFFTKGCFAESTFADLQTESPSAYASLHLIIDWAYVSPVLTLLYIVIFSYYVCYKLPREEEDKPEWADDEFIDKLKQKLSFQWFKTKKIHKSDGSFAKLHANSTPSLDPASTTTTTLTSTSGLSSESESTTTFMSTTNKAATAPTSSKGSKPYVIGVDKGGRMTFISSNDKLGIGPGPSAPTKK